MHSIDLCVGTHLRFTARALRIGCPPMLSLLTRLFITVLIVCVTFPISSEIFSVKMQAFGWTLFALTGAGQDNSWVEAQHLEKVLALCPMVTQQRRQGQWDLR
jgi:hypothetical protein